jgi:hypothetical protein
MSIISIAPIQRAGSHVIISLTGPSGSGKTYTGILIARGLVGPNEPIGFLDTETGRGRLYSDIAGACKYGELTAPFSPDRYIEAIEEFERTGIKALIIDSISHEWEGTGGVVEMAEATNRKDYGKWAMPKAKHKKFMGRLLSSRMHLILCCRARQPIREEITESGKKEIIVGDWKEIQEKGFIYEVTVSVLLRPDGTRKITKCPAALLPAFAGDGYITPATGEFIATWVGGGSPVNHALEELRRAGQVAAENGSKEFGKWWNLTDVKQQRDALRPFLDNFASIAKTADDEATRLRAEQDTKQDDDPFAGRDADSVTTRQPEPPPTPAADFWTRDDLAIAPQQKDGKTAWQGWETEMRAHASNARDEDDLRRLDVDNSSHWDAFTEANQKAAKLLRLFFSERRDKLRAL